MRGRQRATKGARHFWALYCPFTAPARLVCALVLCAAPAGTQDPLALLDLAARGAFARQESATRSWLLDVEQAYGWSHLDPAGVAPLLR